MEIKYTCSLGRVCQTSHLLKKNHLKKASYPFDWIHSNPEMILHCLKDDFTVFLDKSNYVNLNEKICGHSYYHEKMFNHHNPLSNEEEYYYYVRTVKRFRRLLQRPEHKLFVMMNVNLDKMEDTQNMIEFNESFSKYTKNYTLLVIYHVKEKKNYHKFTHHDNIDFLELHTPSESDGLLFKEEKDNDYLNEVFMKNYRFNLHDSTEKRSTFFDFFKHFIIFMILLVCFILFYRRYRTKVEPVYMYYYSPSYIDL